MSARTRAGRRRGTFVLLVLVATVGRPAASEDPALASATVVAGRVVDAVTHQPVAGAVVVRGDAVATTEAGGAFRIDGGGDAISARAVGYRRASGVVSAPPGQALEIALEPFRPKALYLSFYGIGDRAIRESALRIIDATALNALVIDVKNDMGKIPYRSGVALAAAVGAQGPTTIPDVDALLTSLHAKGLYTIARIVVFKDAPLVAARPDLAVRTQQGEVWHDREHLPWTDPFRAEVRDYNLDIAVEAARHGFDEIQFDYVRFPDARGLAYARPNERQNRVAAIGDFLREARRRLAPYNVFLAADVFGYVCWNVDDTTIGQQLEDLAPLVDYVSPMLYPSSFQFGIPGYRDPVSHSYEIVRRSLERARARTGLPAVRFRPWLQAFKDYAFDRRAFDADEIRAQTTAADEVGSDGWMLWNPRNVYSEAGLAE